MYLCYLSLSLSVYSKIFLGSKNDFHIRKCISSKILDKKGALTVNLFETKIYKLLSLKSVNSGDSTICDNAGECPAPTRVRPIALATHATLVLKVPDLGRPESPGSPCPSNGRPDCVF